MLPKVQFYKTKLRYTVMATLLTLKAPTAASLPLHQSVDYTCIIIF